MHTTDMNGHLTKEEFVSLSDEAKWGWIYETLTPMAEDYEAYRIIKKFGVGLGTLIVAITGIGSAALWIINHIK